MRVRSQRGFTLVELLITIVICGIIAAIAIPSLLAARKTVVTKRFEKHFGFSIEPFISSDIGLLSRPSAEWLTDDQKTLLRPLVAAKIESICKDPMGPMTQAFNERNEFLAQPADMTAEGVANRLKRLAELDMNVDATHRATDESFAACEDARKAAEKLGLSPL